VWTVDCAPSPALGGTLARSSSWGFGDTFDRVVSALCVRVSNPDSEQPPLVGDGLQDMSALLRCGDVRTDKVQLHGLGKSPVCRKLSGGAW
jgi:hypothetical protein